MKYIVFSMDCELAWGYADRTPPVKRVERMRADPSAVRDVYRNILNLYDDHGVRATWAFVGHLFYDSCNPDTHPTNKLTANADPHTSRAENPLYYGLDLVNMVRNAELEHDIGGHSFTHPEFTALDRAEARAELGTMINAAAAHGIEITSFVFPRNLVAHTDLLDDVGIEVYRTEQVGKNHVFSEGIKPFLCRNERFWRIPPVRAEQTHEEPVRIKTSRPLQAGRWYYLNPWRLKKTIRIMNDGEIAHLTFHPHDLLGYYRLDWVLNRTLNIVERFRKRGELEVVTMSELPDLVQA